MFIHQIGARTLAGASVFCLSMGYLIIYLAKLFELSSYYFRIPQILYGLSVGFGCGIGYSSQGSPDGIRQQAEVFDLLSDRFRKNIPVSSGLSVNVIAQQWLDKKRAQFNPYLLIGAPIFGFFVAPLFTYLCETYTWSGACLISVGIMLHGLFIVLLWEKHPEFESPKSKPFLGRLKDASKLLKNVNAMLMIFMSLVSAGFVWIPYYTQISNVVSEYGKVFRKLTIFLLARSHHFLVK